MGENDWAEKAADAHQVNTKSPRKALQCHIQATRNGLFGANHNPVREGLRLVEEREAKLKALRDEINAAIDSGPRLTADEVSAGLDARMKQWKLK